MLIHLRMAIQFSCKFVAVINVRRFLFFVVFVCVSLHRRRRFVLLKKLALLPDASRLVAKDHLIPRKTVSFRNFQAFFCTDFLLLVPLFPQPAKLLCSSCSWHRKRNCILVNRAPTQRTSSKTFPQPQQQHQ